MYGVEAKRLSAELKDFPARDRVNDFRIMNDAATLMFIKAEALMHQGKNDEAKKAFEGAMAEYPWAQAWDPSRGAYWSIKEKSQASIRILTGEDKKEELAKRKAPKTKPHLAYPGKTKVVNYLKYGKFLNVGTKNFHYQITNQRGLIAALGETIYPNIADVYKDVGYKKALKQGRLKGSHWDFVNSDDREAAIYKWATAPEPWGVKLFYLGVIYEKAKMYYEAIKAYQALIVHFPNTYAWTYWQTPWYPAQAAISKIQYIINLHPELHLVFKGAKIKIANAFDNDTSNDVTVTNPGALHVLNALDIAKQKLHWDGVKESVGKPVKIVGKGRVQLAQYANKHWQVLIEGKPFLIKGITYNPAKVGQSPDKGTLTNWMESDENHNGMIDGPYEAWVDKNHNNVQDSNEPSVGDFALMKEMGVNTLRLYHQPMKLNKALLEKMYKDYGFMIIMGDFLGKYAIGSGATWAEGIQSIRRP